jgi:cation diffusion facilitator family transporter
VAAESRAAVIAAIVGNLAIAVSKAVVAFVTGSSAMLSEAIHSVVDTGNGALLLYGMRRSKRPPDPAHPFGHGHELYFWALIVGVLVFGLGGGMSIVNGVRHVLEPVEITDAGWSYAVLGVAAIFESVSWWFGWRAFRGERRGRGIVETIERSKDPTTFAVLLEDSAALLGLVFAFVGVAASEFFGMPWVDGAASILIGLLLCAAAGVMMNESRKLLVGEGMERATLETIRQVATADPAVAHVGRLLTLYLGPEEVMLVIELNFHDEISIAELREAMARLKGAIRAKYPRIQRVFYDSAR